MKVEKLIKSNNFPISIQLLLTHEDASDELQADSEEKQLVNEKIEAGLSGENL